MFTGIVEETGTVANIDRKKNLSVIGVKAKRILTGVKTGDSVAIDGVCLTVTSKRKNVLYFDVMRETMLKTTLGTLQAKRPVNLERPLKANGRLDGHFVSGHVDTMGKIRKKISRKNYTELQIDLPKFLSKYIVPKGSVTIDGISLTVGEVKSTWFSVYLIPHTKKVTTLDLKKVKDKVNIEADILAKYVVNSKG